MSHFFLSMEEKIDLYFLKWNLWISKEIKFIII